MSTPQQNISGSLPEDGDIDSYRFLVNERTYVPSKFNLGINAVDTSKIKWCGIIFYFMGKDPETNQNTIFYIVGKTKKSEDLTDFTGERHNKSEDPISTAIKECNDRTRNVFKNEITSNLRYALYFYNDTMLTIYIPLTITLDSFNLKINIFEQGHLVPKHMINNQKYNEISALKIISDKEIKNIFSDEPSIAVIPKIRRFMYSSKCFNEENYPKTKQLFFNMIEVKQKSRDAVKNYALSLTE